MDTFEFIAFKYFNGDAYLHTILILILGGIVAGFVQKTTTHLKRSAYFFNTAFLIFATSLTQLVWFFDLQAIIGGYLPILVLFNAVVFFGCGYGILWLAKMRSLDAFGTPSRAFLSFIPFANLYLLFSPSQDSNRGVSISRGQVIIYVIGGLALYGISQATQVAISSELESRDFAEISVEDSEIIQRKYFHFYAQQDGITAALEYLASLSPTGRRVDDITTLASIEVDGDTMTYIYRVSDTTIGRLRESWKDQNREWMCSGFEFAIDKGAEISALYYSDVQSNLATITANRATCR